MTEPPRGRGDALARAALWGSALLTLIAATPLLSGSPSDLCALPREARAEAGWTREVVCGGGAKSRRGVRGPAVLLFGEKLDLNRAGVRELDILPGIGPARAEAIVRARCQERFRQIEDLQQIRGIGATTTSAIGKWAEVKEGASAVNGGESSVACGDSGVQREILEPAAGLPDEG